MASGYITSDGKDLDQRYLGIDAKAKSAEMADVAKKAEEAIGLVNNRYISKVLAVLVDISPSAGSSKTWSAPSDGIISMSVKAVLNVGSTITIAGVTYSGGVSASPNVMSLDNVNLILKKGDAIVANRGGDTLKVTLKFFPLIQR